MATFEIINSRGNILPLSEGKNYRLINIDGQTAAQANISSVVVGDTDGDIVSNVQAQARSIVLDLRIIADVERTKREILNVVKLKQQAKLRWQQDNKLVEIEGTVEAIDMPRWEKGVIMHITLHCAQPFWEDVGEIVAQISEAINLHYFTDIVDDMLYFTEDGIVFGEYDMTRTKQFLNEGDVSVGMIIEIVAYGTVTNPIIYDIDGNFFGCGYGAGNKQVVMQAGDVIVINTRKNEKSVKLNGASILNKIKPSSTWLQLEAGANEFTINSEETVIDNMTFSLIYKQRYV